MFWESWWEHNKERLLTRHPVAPVSPDADAPTRPREIGEVRQSDIVPLLRSLTSDDHCGLRATAILALGKVGDGADLSMVLPGLVDVCPEVRQASCLALGQLGDESAGLRLSLILRDPAELPRVRAFAAVGLGLLHDPDAGAELARVLSAPREPVEVRAAAALALGFGDDPSTSDILVTLLKDRRGDPRLRSLAAHSLARRGRLDSARSLVAATREKSLAVRRAAVLGLGAIRYQSEAQASLRAALERQLAWLESGTLSRDAAASLDESIRELKAKSDREQSRVELVRQSSVRALLHLADSDSDLQTRAFALIALGEIGARESLPALDRILRRSHHPLKAWAGLAAGLLGDKDLLPAVRQAFLRQGETASVRGALAIALGLLEDREIASEISTVASNPEADADLRGHALTALAMMGRVEALRIGKRIVERRAGPGLKRAAAISLGLVGQNDAAERIHRLLTTDQPADVRSAAALGLGYLRDVTVAEELVREAALLQTPFEIRVHAVAALGYLGARAKGPGALASFAWHYDYRTHLVALERLISLL